MSDNEFSGIDFAVGAVRGFRSWRIDVEGKLAPLHQSGVWLPGENLAECHGSPTEAEVPRVEGEDWRERNAKTAAWRADHKFEPCTHGFYAYFKAEGDRFLSSSPGVKGVIEGYGEVLIGTKGFRATKARILALSIEPHCGIWALEPFVTERLRRNYPGVAIFESSFAMRAEFPADAQIETLGVQS